MDRAELERRLLVAQRDIARGEQAVSRQKQLIAGLHHGSAALEEAERVLKTFEELQMLFIAEHARLSESITLAEDARLARELAERQQDAQMRRRLLQYADAIDRLHATHDADGTRLAHIIAST